MQDPNDGPESFAAEGSRRIERHQAWLLTFVQDLRHERLKGVGRLQFADFAQVVGCG